MTDKNELISKIERIISNEELSESEVLQRIKDLYDTHMQPIDTTLTFSDLVSNCLKASARTAKNIVYSGFRALDEMTGGFLENEFIIVGARPAMGKTALLINFALNASHTTPVLFLEYGLFEQGLGARFMAAMSQVEASKITRQTLSQSEWNQLDQRIAPFYKHHLFINSHPATDIDVLKAHCIQKIKEEHIKVIMIDSIQSLHSRRYHRNRDAEMTYISNELKQLAREYPVCVIAASELSRNVETRRLDKHNNMHPQLSDLRDSGVLEQDADKVFFLHRPEYYKIHEDMQGNDLRGKAEIIVAKNTSGALGDVLIRFVSQFTSFYDLDYDIQMPFSQNRLDEIKNTVPF